MTRSLRFPLASLLVLPFAACVPDYDFEGDFAMTYAVITSGNDGTPLASAGTTRIDIRQGLADDDFLVDLGASFCQLIGKRPAYVVGEIPEITISPQPCWHADRPMSLGGTVTWDDDGERLTIVLAGSTYERDGKPRGATTVQFTETW